MRIFTAGRHHYLEFLRNLTSQGLLFTMSLISGSKIDFTRWDPSNFGPTSMFYILSAMFLIAAWCNSTQFIERSVELDPETLKYKEELQSKRPNNNTLLPMLKYTLRHKKVYFAELIIAVTIVQYGLSAMIASSIFGFIHR